jgi:hypothetical protein
MFGASNTSRVGKPEGKRPFGSPRLKRVDSVLIKISLN